MMLMAKVMSIKVGNPLRKLILLKLADNANDKGECWPSYQHIADQCEISRSTAKRHIRALEEMGILRRQIRRNGELNQSNIFFLVLDSQQEEGRVSDAPGWGHSEPGVGSQMPEGGLTENPGGGVTENPRTSHSFEPVNEPVIGEPADAGSQNHQSLQEKINWQKVIDSYHDILPEMPAVKILTDGRKKNLRTFWRKFNFNQQRWESYLRYVAENCRWMLEDRPNGSGGFWRRRNLDYLITERCYVAVKEERSNDR